jgi:arylsulfatase A-like enzyme
MCADAPNVLIVLPDDVGITAVAVFGVRCLTPHFDLDVRVSVTTAAATKVGNCPN